MLPDNRINSDDTMEIIQRVERSKSHVKDWHNNIARWRKLYDMDHYISKGKTGEVQYCLVPSTRILTTDLRWVPVSSLVEGDEIVGFDEAPDMNSEWNLRYRKMCRTHVTKTGVLELPSIKITLSDGTQITSSEDHQWLIHPLGQGSTRSRIWTRSADLHVGDKMLKLSRVWDDEQTWDAGYLAAAFDGEGYVSLNDNNGRWVVRVGLAQRSNALLEKSKTILDEYGISYSENEHSQSDVTNIYISKRSHVWEILGKIRPPRLLSKLEEIDLFKGRMTPLEQPTIISIESAGIQTVIALGTESKTLIAEGIASHNSDPTYTNTVDLSVGIMLANRLRWHAYGLQPSMQEQKQTSMIEKLLDGTLTINDEREEILQLYQLYLHFCRDGGAAVYSVYDPILADELHFMLDVPDDEEGATSVHAFKETPLRMQVIDPTAIICLPGGPKRWLAIGRVEERSVLDVESTYGIKIPGYEGQSQDQKAQIFSQFIDFWDYVYKDEPVANVMEDNPEPPMTKRLKVRNTILFAGAPIRGPRIMEGYRELPYTVQFFKPTGKDSKEWHSIIKPLESSISLLERTFNRRAHQIDVYTGLPIVSKTQPGRAVRIDPGLYLNHVNITPDESIEFPAWQGNPPDLNFHIDFLRSRIQQSGFSDVMFGSGASQVAGYALSQLGDQNRIRLEQPIAHLELLLTHWAKKAMRLLEEFAADARICVYGQYRGEDYLEYVAIDRLSSYTVRAEIRPSFPNEETRKTAMATQVKGILSNYTIMQNYLGVEQPDDEENRKIIEAVSNHPVTIQYAIIAELKRRIAEGDEIAQMVLDQMQGGKIPGTPGRPEEPTNAEQLTGLQSPDGQPVPGAEGQPPPGQSAMDQQTAMANAAPQLLSGQVQ